MNIVRLDTTALTAPSSAMSSVQGLTYQGSVVTVPLPDATSATATIDWGDGHTSTASSAASSQGTFDVAGTNTYMQSGTYAITVTVQAAAGPALTLHTTMRVSANPDSAFLNQVYQQLLDRPVDSTGSNEWLNAMSTGMTREQVVEQIESSPEYHRDLIKSYYQTYLGRTASDAEINPWLAAFESGATQEQIKGDFLASPEYARRAGGTAEGLLEAIYRDALGRPLDPSGRATWLPLMGNSLSLDIAIGLIVNSSEAEQAVVQDHYQHHLGRSADATGLANWSGLLAQGGRNEAVLAGILGSDEFFARV